MKQFGKIALALVFTFSVLATTFQPAEAGRKGRAIAGGILGAIAIGIIANEASKDYYEEDEGRCYKGRKVCKEKRVCWENRYGDERCKWKTKCYRPMICD
ncbi:MAG: hypothetical protein ACRBBN_10870 [Methyloligellaceae bacterium]